MEDSEINNKTKAAVDSIIDTNVTKKARLSDVMDWTSEEIAESFREWLDAFDPILRKKNSIWGKRDSKVDLYTQSEDMMISCASYYKDKDIALKESDTSLCDNICNLHIFHIIAELWANRRIWSSEIEEQQVFFHILKTKLNLYKPDQLPQFVHRLITLSFEYSHQSYSVENFRYLPLCQHATFATFFYPNLEFLTKKQGAMIYGLACEHDLRDDGALPFSSIIRQLDTSLSYFDFSAVVKKAARGAINHALEVYHYYLNEQRLGNTHFKLKFNEKPLTITMENGLQVNY